MKLGPFNLPIKHGLLPLLKHLVATRQRKYATSAIILAVLVLLRWWQNRGTTRQASGGQQGRGNVDMAFFKRIVHLVQIVIPSWKCREIGILIVLTVSLVLRTWLSIEISDVNGKIVKAIVDRELVTFVKRIINLALFAVPGSLINSGLDYLSHTLAIQFRDRLSNHMNQTYLKDMVFYQMTNIDKRISNPDQRLTQDIDKWASCLANVYSNISKPILDIYLFSRRLASEVGSEGPIITFIWYFLTGLVIRFISPPFGKLTAQEQRNEGLYRSCHSDLVNHCEEIAFYQGQEWENERLNNTFAGLSEHVDTILNKKFYMGIFDSMITKYGATMTAYFILGLPVFGPNREKYLLKVGGNSSVITKDYIRNMSLLTNLSKAIGRLVVSYKDLQALAGYTSLITETQEVINDLCNGNYIQETNEASKVDIKQRGRINENQQVIQFQNVPVAAPNGEVMVEKLSFKIEPGMHTFIQGPNGCGKSSLFRILGGLWPLFDGELHKPSTGQLFYIPQRPYLPHGTLRDQIIYPHTHQEFQASGNTDQLLDQLMEIVKLGDLPFKRGGYDKVEEWNDTLSGGQKQRVAMCRLLYHKPKFAILDECTSAVSGDAEGDIYRHYKESGITLITVSHRDTLMQYHNYLLKLDGEGGYEFTRIVS